MALNELKQKYKDDPEALKRIETIEQQAYGVGQADNIDEDYADRVASGQSLMSGGGKIWYEDAEGSSLRGTEQETSSIKTTPTREADLGSSSSSGISARRESVSYDDMYERAQNIVNPRVKSMMEQIESAMLRARESSAQNLAARGQATGGLRQETERALTADEMLQKQSAAREGASQTASLAQDMYTQERGFEIQEDQLAEQRRQFNEQMQLALEDRDYQKAQDLIKRMQYEDEKEWEREKYEEEVTREVENTEWAQGVEEMKIQIDANYKAGILNLQQQEVNIARQNAQSSAALGWANLNARLREASSQESKDTLAQAMSQYETNFPEISVVKDRHGLDYAVKNVALQEKNGIINEPAANEMIKALYAKEPEPEAKDLDPYIKSIFFDDEDKKIENPNEFLNWLGDMTSPDKAYEWAKTYNVPDKDLQRWAEEVLK